MKRKTKYLSMVLAVCCILSGCGTGTAAQKQKKEANQNKEQSVYKKDPQQNSYEGMQEKYPEWFERDSVVYPYSLDSKEMQKAESYQERTDLINLPVEIAEKTNTETLFSLAEEYPLMDFSLYDSTEIAVENYQSVSHAYEVLLQRDNAPDVALDLLEKHIEDFAGESDFLKYSHIYDCIKLEMYLILSGHGYERLGQEHAEQIAELMQRAHDLWEEKGDLLLRVEEEANYAPLVTDERWKKIL